MDVDLNATSLAFHHQYLQVLLTPLTQSSQGAQTFSIRIEFRRSKSSEMPYTCRCSLPIHPLQLCQYSIAVSEVIPFTPLASDSHAINSDSLPLPNQSDGVVIPIATTRVSLEEVVRVLGSVPQSEAVEELPFILPSIKGDSIVEEETSAALKRLQGVCEAIDGLSRDLTHELQLPSSRQRHPPPLKTAPSRLLHIQSTKVPTQSAFRESGVDFTKISLQSGSLPLLVETHSECCEVIMAILKERMKTEPDLIPEYNESHKYSAPRDVQEMIAECDVLIGDLNSVENSFSQVAQESYFRRIFSLYKRIRAKIF